MHKKWSNLLCLILILTNIGYAWFVIYTSAGLRGFVELLWPLSGFVFNGVFIILFPVFNIILLLNRNKIKWVDYSLLYVPPILWWWTVGSQFFGAFCVFGAFFGGSYLNFIGVNPAMIGTFSCLYLVRFWKPIEQYPKMTLRKKVVILWLIIFLMVTSAHALIPWYT